MFSPPCCKAFPAVNVHPTHAACPPVCAPTWLDAAHLILLGKAPACLLGTRCDPDATCSMAVFCLNATSRGAHSQYCAPMALREARWHRTMRRARLPHVPPPPPHRIQTKGALIVRQCTPPSPGRLGDSQRRMLELAAAPRLGAQVRARNSASGGGCRRAWVLTCCFRHPLEQALGAGAVLANKTSVSCFCRAGEVPTVQTPA